MGEKRGNPKFYHVTIFNVFFFLIWEITFIWKTLVSKRRNRSRKTRECRILLSNVRIIKDMCNDVVNDIEDFLIF